MSRGTICDAGIVGFSPSGDFSEAVFSPNNHQLLVVKCKDNEECSSWSVCATLEQHDQSVSAASWHGPTDRILSCAQDRTAYVWVRSSKGVWEPQVVLLDAGVKRGLTCCAWSASGSKIYVGSAAANIAVGCFEDEGQWWICRLLSQHCSTVTALAPHPSDDKLLASGSTDGRLLIVSTFIKRLDGNKVESFGHVYLDKNLGAWVHSAAWSSTGDRLAVSTHDSRVHVLESPPNGGFLQGDQIVTHHIVNMSILPLKALAFIGEDRLVGGGFDFYPVLITLTQDGWRMTGKWAVKQTKKVNLVQKIAREKFLSDTLSGRRDATLGEEEQTRHKNTINWVCCLANIQSKVVQHTEARAEPSVSGRALFATASMDGRVELWTMDDMSPL
ncbi:WD domain [Trypanosoma vivax]|uniref:Arp2/3 complex 41 kDa subunit n=1 Tax=Trypanosoma vivax (strain Y486) TaxID=1055687 RepID=G0U472_TRYVY|nr:putative actin related protein 2/3 complex [Trypanosoma vivax]KAH8611759.1 WD domain [Trypanosoma vivax]CCC52234.1 putative actin related protein 2/3 complex [Trypanosoma vivax Y486]